MLIWAYFVLSPKRNSIFNYICAIICLVLMHLVNSSKSKDIAEQVFKGKMLLITL